MAATNVQAFPGDVQISSNLVVDTNTLFVDSVGGAVGIGTTNPVGVNGGRRLEGSSTTGFEYIATNDSSNMLDGEFAGAYLFKNDDTGGTRPHYAGMTAYTNGTGGSMDLRFFAARDVYEDTPLEPHMTIDKTGKVGIGTDNPTSNLHVVGDIYSTGNITAYSDKRAKENIEKIENALDKVCTLGGYTYTMKGQKYTGLIAQEVLEVLPEAVTGSEETNYALAYGNMMGLIVEAIKELKEKIG